MQEIVAEILVEEIRVWKQRREGFQIQTGVLSLQHIPEFLRGDHAILNAGLLDDAIDHPVFQLRRPCAA